MTALYIAPALLALCALFLLILYLVFRKTFYMSDKAKQATDIYDLPPGVPKGDPVMTGLIRDFAERPYEQITITARDGTRLCARYHHIKDGAPLEILCHGYRGTGLRDLCGCNPLALELEHNTLLIDQRSAGGSSANVITFGIRERFDIIDWVNYAVDRFGNIPIFLIGISMGGASVLMAGGEALPPAVRGIVSDCAYSAPADIIKSVIRMMHLPPRPAFLLVRAAARLYGGFSLSECTALDAITRAKVPILLLHGECDRLVPCDMSRALEKAAGGKATLYTFPGADHGMSCMSDPERHKKILFDFFGRCLD